MGLADQQHVASVKIPSPTGVRYLVLAGLCLAGMIAYVHRNSIGVAEQDIRADLGLSEKQMGLVMSAFFATYAIAQLPTAWLAHLWGTRRGLPLCSLIGSAAMTAVALAGSLPALLAARLELGIAQAGMLPCATISVSKWFPATKRALASGLLGSSLSIGGALGATLTGLLLPSIGWRWLFLGYAVPGILWAVWFYLWFRERPQNHPAVNQAELDLILPTSRAAGQDRLELRAALPWREIFTSPAMGWICGQQFFRAAGYTFYASWFATFLRAGRGVSLQEAGILTSLPLCGIVCGGPLGGMLSDWLLSRTGSRRLGRQGVAIASLVLSALLILVARPITEAWLAVLLITAGSFFSAFSGAIAYAISIDMGGQHVAPVFSTMNMSGNVGAMLFPVVVPWLLRDSQDWDLVLFFFAGIHLAAALCWACLNPTGIIGGRRPTAFQEINPMHHLNTPQSICRFGLARCDVTPPIGIYHRMWGAASHDQATGVHRPLTATALAFQSLHQAPGPATEQVVVAIDLCLLWSREMEDLIAAVCRQTGLAPEQLVVTFSHTHGAGLMDRGRANLPGGELIGPYLDTLAARVAEIVTTARQAVQPVTIVYGAGRCPLAANRDFWDATSGQFICGLNPDGPADDTVLVARITTPAGQALANLVNYACHPTTLAWENTLISPDYPGAMRELVERTTGVPCVFLQGASGDLGAREGFVGDVAVADRNGHQLGFAALAALEGLPPPGTCFEYTGPVVSGATLGTWAHRPLDANQREQRSCWRWRRWTVNLPYRPELQTLEQTRAEQVRRQAEEHAARSAGDQVKARDARAMVERMTRWLTRIASLPPGPTFPFPMLLWQMGDAFWLAVEAEHYQLLQCALRQRFPHVFIVVVTLANGARVSYLPTREAYGKGIYQDSIAVLAPGCLEAVIEEAARQIRDWLGT